MPRLKDIHVNVEIEGVKYHELCRVYVDGDGRFWGEVPKNLLHLTENRQDVSVYTPIKTKCVRGTSVADVQKKLTEMLQASISITITKEIVICANVNNQMSYALNDQKQIIPNCQNGGTWHEQSKGYHLMQGSSGGLVVGIKCYVKKTKKYGCGLVRYDYYQPSHINPDDEEIYEEWKNTLAEDINKWLLPYPMKNGGFNCNCSNRVTPYECEFPYTEELGSQVLHAIKMYFQVAHVFSELFNETTFMELPNHANILGFVPSIPNKE